MQNDSFIYKFYYQWWKNIDKSIFTLISLLFIIGLFFSLVSTAIIAIGFIAIFQMVQYSIRSIDVSGERTKSSLLISMVAEDLISEKNASSPTSKVSLTDYLINQEKSGKTSWNAPSCNSGSSTSQTFTNTVDAKKYKWANRFSKT